MKFSIGYIIIVQGFLCDIIQGSSDPDDNQSNQNDYEYATPGEPLSPIEFANAEKLNLHQVAPNITSMDPIELAGLFEGDIMLNDDESLRNEGRHITDSNKKWPSGIVPYQISASYSDNERTNIARGILEFERQTCIQFRPWQGEHDFIMLTKGDGCSSKVGRSGGQQDVILGDGCVVPGIVMHELSHVINFWHQHSRSDRDEYITVHYDNIRPGLEDNFDKHPTDDQNRGLPYDTSSIMHYGSYAFSKSRREGKRTITPKVPNDRMGQRENFTEIDVYKINQLYDCRQATRNKTGLPSQPTTTTENTRTTEKCEDNHSNCQKWASNGECEKNPNWMLVNCKLSCNQCGESCTNKNKHCDYWAANGECDKNPGYMHVYCAKSCKRC